MLIDSTWLLVCRRQTVMCILKKLSDPIDYFGDLYEFAPRIMDNPSGNEIITMRNLLNLQAIKEHGSGTPYLIRYRYEDEHFE
ncbi:hypothetical protein [Aliikangiella sp. IMCC44359]|uniref:hypothetical protein n=1 Tax=Aliikangiella sp. IMCC44359 TaxID=3459125 RepID=UPI00403B2B70